MSMTEEHTISLQPGTVIGGKYEVVKCLGSGSMGLVYACRNRVLGQMVAVKVLFPEVASDKVASARFKNEILASYEVSHPNVVRAYEYITERDLVAYTMEFVGGGDLASRLGAEERMPIPEIVRMLSQMAAGCQAIHDADIVHRDLKPENILLTSDGNVKIADFGIARNRHGPNLTEHGGVVGTIDYVAPEYMLKSQVDWRSDIYALGILAYEMVTGESPFRGDCVYATMTKRLKTDPEPPSKLRSDCPAELDRIILKAMEREPEKRYQASIEMFSDLQKLASLVGVPNADAGSMPNPAPFSGDRKRPSIDLNNDLPPASATPPRPSPATRKAEVSAPSMSAGAGGEASVSRGRNPSSTNLGPREPTSDDILEGGSGERRRGSGTEVLDSDILDHAGEVGSLPEGPYSTPEPLMTIPPMGGQERPSGSRAPLPDGYSRGRRLGHRRRDEGKDSYVGEMIALCFAAAVGIGCGFMFLRFFAPSLLEKWHF